MPLVQDNVGEILKGVRAYLTGELSALHTTPILWQVSLGNPARTDAGGDAATMKHTLLTLLRTEEEASRKTQRNYRVFPSPDGNPPGIVKRNPAVVLNFYLLVAANHTSYENALTAIGDVVAIFQHRPVLTAEDLPALPPNGTFATRRLKFSILSPSLEDWNHIWGMLGGRHLPALVYLVQSLEVELIPDQSDPSSPITEIQLKETLQ